jgi:hypothetical protein
MLKLLETGEFTACRRGLFHLGKLFLHRAKSILGHPVSKPACQQCPAHVGLWSDGGALGTGEGDRMLELRRCRGLAHCTPGGRKMYEKGDRVSRYVLPLLHGGRHLVERSTGKLGDDTRLCRESSNQSQGPHSNKFMGMAKMRTMLFMAEEKLGAALLALGSGGRDVKGWSCAERC